MTGEIIENSRCQCIMPFERLYILRALEEAIQRQDNEIKKVQKRKEEIKRDELFTAEKLIEIHKHIKRDFQIVLKRTDNTPACN